MKLFKKIALLLLAAITCFSFGLITACTENDNSTSSSSSASSSSSSSSSEDPGDDNNANFLYRIKVQNETGHGFSGARVSLMSGGQVIASAKTNSNGYATFVEGDIDEVGEYTINVTDIPNGYDFSSSKTQKTGAWKGYEATVQIEPTGVLQGNAPLGTVYKLGDVMYDFTAKTSDGRDFTLSEELEEKGLVMINFWATWCGPCKSEFPAMNNAYVLSQDYVSILAISTTDTMAAVSEFKSQNGISFDMTSNMDCGASIMGMFNTSSIPVTIMVDRYGVICYYHVGSMTEANDFISRFDRFSGDDYKPTIIVGSGEEEGGPEEEESNAILPNVAAPSLSDVKATLENGNDDFTFSWYDEDLYSWPWLISSEGYIYSPIAEKSLHGNYSTLTATFNAEPGDVLHFDYMVNTETEDVLYVVIDGEVVQQISGINNSKSWVNDFGAYVFKENYDEAGQHELQLIYRKDSSGSVDAEAVLIKNLRLEKFDATKNLKSNVFRNAANVVNTDENATSYYKYYANVVLNEEDGYYHVGTEDGPLLFASLMLSSQWSEQSVWNLAYSGYIVTNGYNFSEEIENEAWAANQPVPGKHLTYGYVPVTETLKELLIYATKSAPIREDGYKNWTGKWHENEWLEICVYFDNYGAAPIEDPMKTITFHAAEKVIISTPRNPIPNTANIQFSMTPRGFKYKIVPEETAVYHIYSVGDYDTVCFFFGESTTNVNKEYSGTSSNNFDFHVTLEAGKTYYLALTTYLDTVCKYDFYVTYTGSSYEGMAQCSSGLYSYTEDGTLFLQDAIRTTYDAGNDVYTTLKGEKIYADMLHTTNFFNSNSLYLTARADLKKTDKTQRNFYIDGVDYTELIYRYGQQSMLNDGEFFGYVELNDELMQALKAITMSAKFDGTPGTEDSWQLVCYYYAHLGE